MSQVHRKDGLASVGSLKSLKREHFSLDEVFIGSGGTGADVGMGVGA